MKLLTIKKPLEYDAFHNTMKVLLLLRNKGMIADVTDIKWRCKEEDIAEHLEIDLRDKTKIIVEEDFIRIDVYFGAEFGFVSGVIRGEMSEERVRKFLYTNLLIELAKKEQK
jgi:hypothetical protein